MDIKTKTKIVNYLTEKKQASAKELSDFLNISRQALYKQLTKLISNKKISKIGRPPKVLYFINKPESNIAEYDLPSNITHFINEKYLIITPAGIRKEGIDGLIYWCNKNKLPIIKTALEYYNTIKKYEKYKKNSFINGIIKIKNTFPKLYLDKLFYLDFYSIERFGKTKLGWLLLYAKQSQNKSLIKELVFSFENKIKQIIKKYKIEAVGFIPPTVKREVQFMNELKKNLNLTLPIINIDKIKTPIIVPQKTLNKLEDRIENAQNTIFIRDERNYSNILLIDDAVGSGATLNEIAKKIKEKKLVSHNIYGLAITGSFKGFDVISEV